MNSVPENAEVRQRPTTLHYYAFDKLSVGISTKPTIKDKAQVISLSKFLKHDNPNFDELSK